METKREEWHYHCYQKKDDHLLLQLVHKELHWSSPHHRLELDSDTAEPELLALHFPVFFLVGVHEEAGRVVESVALILPRSTRDPLTFVPLPITEEVIPPMSRYIWGLLHMH